MSEHIQSLNEEWRKYRDAIYPEGISGTQNRETHQAFFAGAFIMSQAMEIAATLPDAEAVKFIGRLMDESQQVCGGIAAMMRDRN